MNNYGYGLSHSYFDQEAEEYREYERALEKAIGNIGLPPFYKIDGEYYDEKTAIEILEEECKEDGYLLYEYEVAESEVVEKYF